MVAIRAYRARDLESLSRICLATGDSGADASHLYDDQRILGDVYAAPYATLEPESVFVIEEAGSVAGYIVGAGDTFVFEKRLEREWWPPLRARYSDPAVPRTFDERMAFAIHHPARTPRRISESHPAHLHINLLPHIQGRGSGAELVKAWLSAMHRRGVPRAHLAVGAKNANAVGFYRRFGFTELERSGPPFDVIWFGIDTAVHSDL